MVDSAQKTARPTYNRKPVTYDQWMEAQGIPIHRGFYIKDGRTVDLGWWKERECNAAFLQLAGQEGVSEARITEVPPGGSLKPFKMACDDIVYVLQGRGMTTISAGDGSRHSFEWQDHSLFRIPGNFWTEHANMGGDKPVRLLSVNNLPIAMSAVQDPSFFFNSKHEPPPLTGSDEDGFYSVAQAVQDDPGSGGRVRAYWYGNFFPDMRAWDQLVPFKGRGAGGHVVFVQFPGSELTAHMSVFAAKTYKKAHRHGPAFVIVIPAGEGYSVMWPEGQEKVWIPWHEGSIFVPPNRWFHQHFNLGRTDARYLAFHPLPQFLGTGEKVEDRTRDQIEYPYEDPAVRETFERELAKRGLKSEMPARAYEDPSWEWDYGE